MVSQVPHSSFIEATKEDIRVLLKWMEKKDTRHSLMKNSVKVEEITW
jgi:hypothetical protein